MSVLVRRIVRRIPLILAGTALVLVTLHLGGVAMLRYFVERELHPALPKGTRIGEIHINPLRGSIEIRRFYLRSEGVPRLRADLLSADVDTLRLLTGQVRIERVVLSDAYVRVDRRPDGSFDVGLPDFGADSGPNEGPPPDVIVDEVSIDGLTIDFRDGDTTSLARVDKLNVGGYSLRSESQQIPISWDVRWDGQRIEGAVDVAVEGDRVEATGTLSTDPLDLERAQRLARLDPQVVGRLGFNGELGWHGDKVTIDGALRAPSLDYRVAGREVAIGGAKAPGFSLDLRLEPELSATLDLGKGVAADTWSWSADGQRLTGQEVVQLGRVVFSEGAQATVQDFRLSAARLSWQSGPRSAEVNGLAAAGRLSQDLRGEGVLPAMDLTAKASATRFEDETAELSVEIASLDAEQLLLVAEEQTPARRLSGRLSLGSSVIEQGDQSIELNQVKIEAKGDVGAHSQNIDGDVDLRGIEVKAPVLPHGPLTLGAIQVSGLNVGESYGAAELTASDLALPGGLTETGLEVVSIAVRQATVDASGGVGIDEILVDGLKTGVIRDEAGIWRHVMTRPTAGQGDAPPGASEPRTSDDGGLPWRLGGIRITGESVVTVADRLNPDMQPIRYQVDKVSVGGLDSQRPGVDTSFELLVRPDQYSEFAIAGTVRPLDEALYLDAEGHLHGFGLTSVNGFVANDLGHRFLTGQLDNDFAIKIADNQLEMGNQLSLASLDVEELPDKEGPPLGTAIALLEDRDGNIKLEVPVSGDLSDPDFRVLGALNPIIMKAAAGAAALAIQPFGSVLLVGTLVADQALKVTFEPALFESGSTVLNADAEGYLEELSARLKEKPKLGVKLCGIYAASEREKNKKGEYTDRSEDLIERAQQRADAVRRFMAEQGVGDKQLRKCRPALDPTEAGRPRVDIRF